MILGYLSIGLTVVITLLLVFLQLRVKYYYIGLYVVGSILLLSTTLASDGLVGSDIHLEYYYANQSLINCWNVNLPNTINSCLPIVLLAPALTRIFDCDLYYVFKVIFPLMFALTPLFLFYVYLKFLPLKPAFLAALVFIIVPTFFLEMPGVQRHMLALLEVSVMLALLFSDFQLKWKIAGLTFGTLLLVVSHYSTVMFWFILLGAVVLGYLINKQAKQALLIGMVVIIGLTGFYFYSHWASSGWQVVDIGNTINNMIGRQDNLIIARPDSEGNMVVSETTEEVSGGQSVIGTPFKNGVNWYAVLSMIILLPGFYLLVQTKNVPTVYKALISACGVLLVVAIVYPQVSATINYSRYYLMMMLVMAPCVIALSLKFLTHTFAILILVLFIFSSGLAFNLMGIDNIEHPNIPYSVALENKRLDAGNYLTRDDRTVAEWASKNGIHEVWGDIGATLAMQDYIDIFHAFYLTGEDLPDEVVFIRSWNMENKTLAVWTGPGARRQVAMPEIDRPILFQSGNAILYGVKK